MKKVSIIIPIYNSSASINRCLSSVLKQTYDNVEVLCVDDGSLDDTLDILEEMSKTDERICVVHKENGGVSSARNMGLDKATGEYIVFIDSDDWIRGDSIELLVKNIEQNDADLVICGMRTHNNSRRYVSKNASYSLAEFKKNFVGLYEDSIINSPCNKIYRKELIQFYFDKGISFGEDYIFNLKYLNNCRTIKVIDEELYIYYVAETETLSKKIHKNQFECIVGMLKETEKFLETDDSKLLDPLYYSFAKLAKNSIVDLLNSKDGYKKFADWKNTLELDEVKKITRYLPDTDITSFLIKRELYFILFLALKAKTIIRVMR